MKHESSGRTPSSVVGFLTRKLALPTLMAAYCVQHFLQVEYEGSFTAVLSVRALTVAILLLYAILVTTTIVTTLRRRTTAEESLPNSDHLAEPESAATSTDSAQHSSPWATTAFAVVFIAFIAAIPVVGFIISTAVFLSIATALLGSRSPHNLVVVPVLLTASTYFIFANMLNVRLPSGTLFG